MRKKVIDAEVIVTDPRTGGKKGEKLAQLGAVDPAALLELAKVAGYGGRKYEERMNFLKGYKWSLSIDALFRHLLAFTNGEELDPESGLSHMGHAAWHCLALVSFARRNLGTDDRYHPGLDEIMTTLHEAQQHIALRASRGKK
jgi:hypothetical protein